MANLLRLIAAFMLLCVASSAFALSSSYQYRGRDPSTNQWMGWRSTPQLACQDILGAILANPGNTSSGLSYAIDRVFETGCNIRRSDGALSSYDVQKSETQVCPANSTPSGNSCICSAGYVESGGVCVSKADPDMKCATDFAMAGFGIGQGLGTIRDTKTMSGVVPSGEMCWPHESATSGCLVNFDRTSLTTMPDGSIQSGGSFSMYKGGVGGKACTLEAPPDPGSTVEEKCEQKGSYTDSKGTHSLCLDEPKCEGGFMGTVSYLGGEVCVKDKGGNVIETSKDTIKKNEDGSTDKVTEKTTCKVNTCTTEKTTTTTTNNNSSSSSTTTKTESKEDYCKANANAQQCKGEEEKEGKFGGSCSAGFTCEGDALQCAIAKDQHKRNCQMFDDKTTESQLYDSEVAKGSNRDVTKDLPGNTEVDVSGKLSSEDVLGGGRCIADLNVQVWRSSVSLPFSKICPSLGYLGWVLIAVCSLAAFRIVSGTSKED
ncbi:virulence factor TspB C-terminal domain-related protein [Comamonas thiooxydans]|uniref:virulence factor TspB C-terminal domain-related protein n=1 Tax=Comamonas thiooxydans TaxID=363952 RepID=UPI00244A081D|nr:virulence factor TspB C-terminal domain-related protein [Comamonas thiooxydans]MDH1476629.1 virulence factor TspB C-terminal domain-related protein [Comamonas thiooxydans]